MLAPFKAARAPSTSQNICYGHEERKVTGYTQGVLNTSCLLGIVTFLANQQQRRRECWSVYRVATTILASTDHRTMVVAALLAVVVVPLPYGGGGYDGDAGGGGGSARYADPVAFHRRNPPSFDQIFPVSRIGNPETVLGLRDQPTATRP